MIEEEVRRLPAVREKIETAVAQEMGLLDEENQEAAMQQIQQRQQAMAPQVPGMNGAGPGGPAGPAGPAGPVGPGGGVGPADINTPLTPDTFTPERIDLAR